MTSSSAVFQTYGTDATVYSTGAKIAPGKSLFFSAGGTAPAGQPLGDTKTEALATMANLKEVLAKAGLSLSDVFFVRAYLTPDASGVVDYAGWNAAWNSVFNNPALPHKPARTTVGIPTLGRGGHRIEIEFVCAGSSPTEMAAGSAALRLPVTNARLSPYGTVEARIYSGMGILPGTGLYWTAGMLKKKDCPAPAGANSDTYVQSVSTLENLSENLASVGLSFKDIIFLRAFLAPDPARGGQFDYDGWNRAYGEFFNCARNPHKPARTTVTTPTYGATPPFMIEIEVIAAFPSVPALFDRPDPGNAFLRTYGAPEAQIASGVAVKPGSSLYFSAGAVSAVPGNMKTQALSALEKLKGSLAAAGLGFKDVIFLRAYITPESDGSLDRGGWSEAYHTCFNNPQQPHKPARTTIAVHSLPKPEWKIEIDVIAASGAGD
jgi:enamine deaminase RidA (YjgF/YER057c/UK114 family)